MMAYWLGFMTPFAALAVAISAALLWEAIEPHITPWRYAIEMLAPKRQRLARDNLGKPSRSSFAGDPLYYDNRHAIWHAEAVLKHEARPMDATERLLRFGCYPILRKAIPQYAEKARSMAAERAEKAARDSER